jgi:hypothetical protein
MHGERLDVSAHANPMIHARNLLRGHVQVAA